MSVIIKGGASNALANVDINGNLLVNLPTSASTAGYVSNIFEMDAGTITGSKKMAVPYISSERRMAVGLDTPFYDYTFNSTVQDTGLWRYVTSTMTTTWSTTGMLMNAIQSTASGNGTAVSSYKVFTLTGNGSIAFDFTLNMTAAPLGNQIFEFGIFPFGAGNVVPTEGVYFRYSSAGLQGIMNFNTTETQVTLDPTFLSANTNYTFRMTVNETDVSFYRNGILYYELAVPLTQGQPFITGSLPITFQFRNPGVVTGSPVMQAKITDISVDQKSINLGKQYPHIQTAKGLMGSQGTNGNTMGSTALFTNSLAPGAGVVMTNTTAALGSGLGGQFAAQPTLAANTDGIVCSYQVPAGSINITPRTLYVTGIKVQGAVTSALTNNTLGVTYAYSLAYGHTAVSMATGEGVAAKAPRRIPLGWETFASGATNGVLGQGVTLQFNSPIVVNPGEFIAVTAKNVGTVTAAGVITFLVAFDSYWE